MKSIEKYITQRADKIHGLLQKTPKAGPPGFYHKLRIEIKKLDAFLRLLEFCAPGFDRKKTEKPFRVVFRQAGKIRELQIGEAMLKKYVANLGPDAYKKDRRNPKKQEQLLFLQMADPSLLAKQKMSLDKALPFLKRVDLKKVQAYLKKKRKKIGKILREKPLPPSNLHELRKRLKTYGYIQKGLNIDTPYQSGPLLQLLGQWHDHQTTLAHLLKMTDTDERDADETKRLETIRSTLLSESNRILGTIRRTVPTSPFFDKPNPT